VARECENKVNVMYTSRGHDCGFLSVYFSR